MKPTARGYASKDPPGRSERAERPLLGIGLMLIGVTLVPLLDGCAKLLSEDYSVVQIAWGRFVFHVVWLMPLLVSSGARWWRLPALAGFQAARGFFLVLATVSFFFAIRYVPIPNALALLFVSPIVVALLSPRLLGEPFHWSKLCFAGVGFLGVLVILRPATEAFEPAAFSAILAGLSYAGYVMTTRYVAPRARPLLTLFHSGVIGSVVLSLVMPAVWIQPDLRGWVLMSLMGLFAAAGHFMIIKACEYAKASLLAPFGYAEIVSSTAMSWFLFDYWPDVWVWVGIAIIVVSGVGVSLFAKS